MTTITEDYVSFEVAKLLNEKGFEIDTNNDYWKIGEDGTMYFMSSIGAYTSNPNNEYAFYRPENSYPCPTHQMAMKWLREICKLSIEPYVIATEENCIGYAYAIYSCKTSLEIFAERWDGKNPFVSYEEAVEVALKYSLENLI